MLIQCTKKLLDQLKVKPELNVENVDPLFAWHANLITINRKKAVVLVNDSNRYVVVLYGLIAKDFKALDELILEAIRHVFLNEGIQEEIIEEYIQHAPKVTFTKTKDRTSVARMNKSSEFIFEDLLDSNTKVQTATSYEASRLLVGNGKNSYLIPNEALYRDLEKFSKKKAIQIEAVQLKVTLELAQEQVWRRLIVPMHYTFEHLHEILQTSFQWDNSHLHTFYIYREGKGENATATNIPMEQEQEAILSDYVPTCKRMKYIYDFGDDWQHEIEVESIIDDYDKNLPVCLEGVGNAPPENIGGPGGYEHILEILSDKNHPEHEFIAEWMHMQQKPPFNIKQINSSLRFSF